MKKLPPHELPIVPTANLVDIAILLIIFYMACSNFVSSTSAKITLPKAPDIDKVNEPLVLVMIDSRGTIYVQGRPVPGPDSVQSIVSSLVEGKETPEARNVMFKCDESVNRKVFEPVLNAIVEGGGIIVAAGEKTGGGSVKRN